MFILPKLVRSKELLDSVELRARLGITTSIAEEVKRERLRLLGHVSRMGSNRWQKVVTEDFFNRPYGNRGRPKKTWLQCVTAYR